MKGKNLVKTPGELYAPTADGVVVSADGVKDYRKNKTQEALNQEILDIAQEAKDIAQDAAGSASSMKNIVEILKEQGEQDIATVLEHEARIEHNEQDIAKLQEQLGDYIIKESSEAEIGQLIENDEADPNTLYLIPEEEEE